MRPIYAIVRQNKLLAVEMIAEEVSASAEIVHLFLTLKKDYLEYIGTNGKVKNTAERLFRQQSKYR